MVDFNSKHFKYSTVFPDATKHDSYDSAADKSQSVPSSTPTKVKNHGKKKEKSNEALAGLSKLLDSLREDRATIEAKCLMEKWNVIEVDVGRIESDADTGKLKAKRGSQILTLLMQVLTGTGKLSDACKFAEMVNPSALSDPLFALLDAVSSSEANLENGDEIRLGQALADACGALLKTEKDLVINLLRYAPERFKGPAVANGLLEILPIGIKSGKQGAVLASLTPQVRSQAFALAVENAGEGKKQKYLLELALHMGKTYPDIAQELTAKMAPKLPDCTLEGYSTGLKSIESLEKLGWGEVVAKIQGAVTANVYDASWGDLELHVARLAKQEKGLELEQLQQLAKEILALSKSDDPQKKALAERLSLRLLEAVPYMEKLPNSDQFDALAKYIHKGIPGDFLMFIGQVCSQRERKVTLGGVLEAELIAINRFPQLDFLGALPKLTSGWDDVGIVQLLSDDERFKIFSDAFESLQVTSNLKEAATAASQAGWPIYGNRVSDWIIVHGDLLTKSSLTLNEYARAIDELASVPDRMFIKAARTKLEKLQIIVQKEKKFPWK